MCVGTPRDNRTNLGSIELHAFLRPHSRLRARIDYEFDDGLSFDYQQGQKSRVTFSARVRRGELRLELHDCDTTFAAHEGRLGLYAPFELVVVIGAGKPCEHTPRPGSWRFAGAPLRVWRTPAFVVQANA